MQPRLLAPEPFDPMPFGWRQYVPALQNRPGELDALRTASDSTWARMTPFMQLSEQRRSDGDLDAKNVASWVEKVATALGQHPCFIDVLRLDPLRPALVSKSKTTPVLTVIYEECRKHGLRFVPVLKLGSPESHVKLVHEAVAHDGRGVCFRYDLNASIVATGQSISDLLARALASVEAPEGDADLVLDLGYLDPDAPISATYIRNVINASAEMGLWRSMVLLATSIPSTLSCVPEGSVGAIARREWLLWNELGGTALSQTPSFGDYAIQHPKPPKTSGAGMRANVRYTLNECTVIARGREVMKEGYEQYQELCRWIVEYPSFSGGGYTGGDNTIVDCGAGEILPRSQTSWRGIGTSHHLRFVTDQIAGVTRN